MNIIKVIINLCSGRNITSSMFREMIIQGITTGLQFEASRLYLHPGFAVLNLVMAPEPAI